MLDSRINFSVNITVDKIVDFLYAEVRKFRVSCFEDPILEMQLEHTK